MSKFTLEVISAIKNAIGVETSALHEPTFLGNELKYLKECIDTGYVSSVGKFVDQFELDLSNYTGSKYAISVVNGTSALHLGLLLAGVKKGDEVIIPALTFIATANAVSYCGATPHLVDSEHATLGLDPDKLEIYLSEISTQISGLCVNKITGNVIKAVVPMHTFGHPIRIERLLEVAKKFNLAVVEDAAESLGSFYKGKHTGTFGEIGILSFNGNKTITTGGGGAILTNNPDIAAKAKHLSTTAKISHEWLYTHNAIAFNFRMPNINAALGCAQLEDIESKLKSKRALFEKYHSEFSSIFGVTLFKEPLDARSNYWLNTLLLLDVTKNQQDEILTLTNSVGIMTRPAWDIISSMEIYQNLPSGDLTVAKHLRNTIINIPSGPGLV